MSELLLKNFFTEPFLSYPNEKPNGDVKVIESNFNEDLVFCTIINSGAGPARDIVYGAESTTQIGGWGQSVSGEMGFQSSATNHVLAWSSNELYDLSGTPFTIFFVYYKTGYGGSYPAFLSHRSSFSDGYWSVWSWPGSGDQGLCFACYNNGYNNIVLHPDTPADGLVIGCVRSDGAGNFILNIKAPNYSGRFTSSNAGSVITLGAHPLHFNQLEFGNTSEGTMYGTAITARIWRRSLDDGEVDLLMDDWYFGLESTLTDPFVPYLATAPVARDDFYIADPALQLIVPAPGVLINDDYVP